MKYSRKIKAIEDNYSIEISELNKKIYMMENSEFNSSVKKNKEYLRFKNNQILKNEYDNDFDDVKRIKFILG